MSSNSCGSDGWIRGWHRLWLECDLISVVNLFLSRSHQVPWEVKDDWLECVHYAAQMNLKVSHIFCEGNSVIDLFAKHELTVSSPICL